MGEQQRVEILKALLRDVQVLILDEPTAVLTPQEVEELFRVMQALKERGKAIIFITHKLRETMAFTDRVTVLRQRAERGDGPDRGTTTGGAPAEMMVGRKVILGARRGKAEAGRVLWKPGACAWWAATDGRRLKDVILHVRAGEMLGIVGVEGNGQLELEEVVTGLARGRGGGLDQRAAALAGSGFGAWAQALPAAWEGPTSLRTA